MVQTKFSIIFILAAAAIAPALPLPSELQSEWEVLLHDLFPPSHDELRDTRPSTPSAGPAPIPNMPSTSEPQSDRLGPPSQATTTSTTPHHYQPEPNTGNERPAKRRRLSLLPVAGSSQTPQQTAGPSATGSSGSSQPRPVTTLQNTPPAPGNTIYECKYSECTKTFSRERDRDRHQLIPEHTGIEHPMSQDPNSKWFKCGVEGCKMEAYRKIELIQHQHKDHENDPIKCSHPGCDLEPFIGLKNLQVHRNEKGHHLDPKRQAAAASGSNLPQAGPSGSHSDPAQPSGSHQHPEHPSGSHPGPAQPPQAKKSKGKKRAK